MTGTAAGVDRDAPDSGVTPPELLAAFSLATDLGLGQPMEHVLRAWRIARRLADWVGPAAEEQRGTNASSAAICFGGDRKAWLCIGRGRRELEDVAA